MRKLLLTHFIFIFVIAGTQLLSAQSSDSILTEINIKNLHKVDSGVYRSKQPNKEQFIALENGGIREVLNLRRLHSDNKEAENTNLKLYHIKVRAEAIKEQHLLQVLKIIKNREGDILIHCHHGSDRTGAVIAMYRIVFQGWSKEEAINEMTNGGYGFHKIYSNIPKLIRKIDVENFKEQLDL